VTGIFLPWCQRDPVPEQVKPAMIVCKRDFLNPGRKLTILRNFSWVSVFPLYYATVAFFSVISSLLFALPERCAKSSYIQAEKCSFRMGGVTEVDGFICWNDAQRSEAGQFAS
jgi:hypothetical protein